MSREQISPPWIVYPDFPPGDPFWRQSGEKWFKYIWKPYWESLSFVEQEEYLIYWKVPDAWRYFYFNSDFQEWLETVDEE